MSAPDVSVSRGTSALAGYCNGCNRPDPLGVVVVRLRTLEFRLCSSCGAAVQAGIAAARRDCAPGCRAVVASPERPGASRICTRRAVLGCYCRQHARASNAP
jgi:hypothetical protein